MAAFQLSKWYFDCVTDSGDVSIAYTGSVRWGKLRCCYSSLLESTAGQVRAQHSLRERRAPAVTPASITWRSDVLQTEGHWQADAAEIRETMLAGEHGSVKWQCLMPRARVRLGSRTGWGYAEHLAMTVPPWELPLETLLWGRFLSAQDWIVWIDWRGPHARRVVYRNGEPTPAEVTDDGIQFPDGARLSLDRTFVIRDGAMGTTTFAGIPLLGQTFPARLLQVHETKWRSRARFEPSEGSGSDGWAIHERVTWPK
jgi:hypothetical protein